MFTIGADPEIFLRKNGKSFSAHGVIPGTKESPFKTEKGAYQVDGMAVEFNIDPVRLDYDGFKTFNNNITSTIKAMRDKVREKEPSCTFKIESVQDFDPDYILEQPKEARELGCNPDFNAYTLEQNPMPAAEKPFRTAAGHVHIGWGEDIPVDHPDHMRICADFIKHLDATLGLYMTLIDREPRRRELYGKAGAFRPKPYGVEYRTPSNVWLTDKKRREAVFFLTHLATDNAKKKRSAERQTGFSQEQVRGIIDEGDWRKAYEGLRYSSLSPSYSIHCDMKTHIQNEMGLL